VSPSVSTVDSGSASATAADKLQEQFYSQAKDGQYRWVLSRKIVECRESHLATWSISNAPDN